MFPAIDKQRNGERIRKVMKQQNILVKQISPIKVGLKNGIFLNALWGFGLYMA
jgi:hypothetical protein